MARKTKVYVDTGALISFLDRSDTYHSTFLHLFADPPPLFMSSLVIAEGHGWFLRRYDLNRALQFLSFIDSLPDLQIIDFGAKALQVASHYIRQYSDQKLTLTDAHGLAIMKQHRIKSCWAVDRHMALTGIPLAIHH